MDEKTIHILVVEDDPAHAELVRIAFRSQAELVKLTVASTLREARTKLQASTPDLVIADWGLPDGTGIELLPTNKENPVYPVLILTGQGDEQMAVEAMKAGAIDYVVKSEATLHDLAHIAKGVLREWNSILARKDAEKLLRLIVESIGDGLVVVDEKGQFTFFNQSAKKIVGMDASDTNPKQWCGCYQPFELDMKTPYSDDDLPFVRALRGESVFDVEIFLRHSQRTDGIWVSCTADPINDHAGILKGAVMVFRDITARKQAEQQAQERKVAQAKINMLSPRERQVLALVVNGHANKVSARQLDLSEKTIEKHRGSFMKKLNVRTVPDLMRLALTAQISEDS